MDGICARQDHNLIAHAAACRYHKPPKRQGGAPGRTPPVAAEEPLRNAPVVSAFDHVGCSVVARAAARTDDRIPLAGASLSVAVGLALRAEVQCGRRPQRPHSGQRASLPAIKARGSVTAPVQAPLSQILVGSGIITIPPGCPPLDVLRGLKCPQSTGQ